MEKSSTSVKTALATTNPGKPDPAFRRIVFLFGPTGVGKTELLLSLDPAKFAVVNADSVQVYRGLDIGSAKALAEVRSRIRHYLIDVEDPWNQFNVARFIALADQAVRDIASGGRIPILCGGTAYYFKQFLYGTSEAPASDPDIREKIASLTEEKGLAWAYARLGEVDPASQKRIHPNDAYRITRALEVYESSGRPLSSFAPSTTPRYGMRPLLYGLDRPGDELSARIALRVEEMFKEGLVEEIRGLLKMGAASDWPGMQGIGYKEFFDAMKDGDCSLGTIKAAITRNSRLYAKRQLTFFRSFEGVNWLVSSESRRRLPHELTDWAASPLPEPIRP